MMTKKELEALINEGIKKCKLGQYEKALDDFDKAAQFTANEKLLYNRSKTFFKLRKIDEAMNDLDTLIKGEPDNPLWYAERAVIYHYSKKSKEALQDLDKAVLLDPSNGFRYASRAFIKDFYGDLEGALRDYEKAIALDPADAISHNNKGLVEEKMGYKDKARVSFANADRLAPNPSPGTVTVIDEQSEIRATHTKTNQTKKMTIGHYFRTIREITKSRHGLRSFLNFIFGKE